MGVGGSHDLPPLPSGRSPPSNNPLLCWACWACRACWFAPPYPPPPGPAGGLCAPRAACFSLAASRPGEPREAGGGISDSARALLCVYDTCAPRMERSWCTCRGATGSANSNITETVFPLSLFSTFPPPAFSHALLKHAGHRRRGLLFSRLPFWVRTAGHPAGRTSRRGSARLARARGPPTPAHAAPRPCLAWRGSGATGGAAASKAASLAQA